MMSGTAAYARIPVLTGTRAYTAAKGGLLAVNFDGELVGLASF